MPSQAWPMPGSKAVERALIKIDLNLAYCQVKKPHRHEQITLFSAAGPRDDTYKTLISRMEGAEVATQMGRPTRSGCSTRDSNQSATGAHHLAL